MFGQRKLPVGGAAQQPGAVPALTEKPGLQLGDILYAFGAQLRDENPADALAQIQDRRAAAAQQKTMAKLLGTITDPRERLAAILSPTEYVKQLATNYAAQKVGAGDTVKFGQNGEAYTAPKVEMAGDSAVSITPDGLTVLGQRPASFKETSDNANELAKLKEAIRAHDLQNTVAQGRLGVAQGQLGIAGGRLNLAKQKQTGGTTSPVLDAIAAELRRRGKIQ